MYYYTYTHNLSTLLSATILTPLRDGKIILKVSFTLRCFQRLSILYIAIQPCHWHDNWYTRGIFNPVLSY